MSSSSAVQTELPNELNLSRYVKVLRRYWWLIVAMGIVGAIVGFAYTALQPVSYRSEAALAIIRTGLMLNLDARARTVSDTDPNAQSVDQIARRRSLTTIGESEDLARQVLEAVGASLPPEVDSPGRLASRVNVSLDSDVIQIQATMPTAEQAALLANTYARVYEQRINALLGESVVGSEALAEQTAQARATYQAKQDAVAAYLTASSIEALKRQADVLSRELDSQLRLQAKLAHLEEDALALQARLKDGGSAPLPGAQLAQLLLEANAFNTEASAAGAQMRIDLNGDGGELVSAAAQAQTLEGLIAAIRARRQAQQVPAQAQMYNDLNRTQAELEQAQATLKGLQAERDLAWNTYQLLATKMAESNITSGYQNEIVRVISPAVVPSKPNASRQTLNTLIGAALGVIVGAGLAFLFEWLPFGKKRAAQAETITAADRAVH